MSPERIESHGDVKSEVCRVVGNLVVNDDRGKFYLDRMRFVHEQAGISNEPEALFISWEALIEKPIRKVPAANENDYIEFEGTPDWVLEIVSPSSVFKDTVKLRELYHRANIPEYWLIDAREAKVFFEILHHAPDGYRRAPLKRGRQYSNVFGKHFRLLRIKDRLGDSAFRLEMK
jgi:Uma2 family endonuclease